MLRFDKIKYFSLLLKYNLPGRLSINLCKSEVLLFFEFIIIVSILHYIYIEVILFLVFSSA